MVDVVKTENLTVGYKNKKIISDINFSVKKGEIVTLIGSNGCGKSTLLRTLAGQQKALGGNIFIGDREIKEYNEIELAKKLSILLTDRVMPLLMTAYDVVCSGRYPYTGRLGILSAEDHERVEEVMELTGITGLRDELFSELSDGQRQRVMLARALSQEPDILIMDEPMTFLDIKYKRELSDIIMKLRDEKNLTMIISLHELHIIKKFTDRVICVKDGKIDKTGSPDELLEDNYIDYLFDMA
ncbi:MAG: ABC transporter ATP-binding protein [Eubacterium sp.]|nr:ABC transporter ATP-binding protein [Eubacterium sp.]